MFIELRVGTKNVLINLSAITDIHPDMTSPGCTCYIGEEAYKTDVSYTEILNMLVTYDLLINVHPSLERNKNQNV